MSETGNFKTEGFYELQKQLIKLGEGVGDKILKKGVWEAAQVIRDEAVARAPEDTGRLREFIGRGMGKPDLDGLDDRFAAVCMVGMIRLTKARLEKLKLTLDVFYARFVERGTRFQKAQPFLGPAFDSKKEEFVDRLKDYLGKAIDKVISDTGGSKAA